MWYRVELNKDGSVKKCTPVEARGKDGGGLVCYIDEDSEVAALRAAQEWRTRYLARSTADSRRRREKRTALGLPAPSYAGRRSILVGSPPTPTKAVIAQIKAACPGRAAATIRRALLGESLNAGTLGKIAVDMRKAGYDVSTQFVDRKPGGIGSRATYELALLRLVEEQRRRLAPQQMTQWLTAQIKQREAIVTFEAAQREAS